MFYPTYPYLESKDLQASLEKMKLKRVEPLMAVRRIQFLIESTFIEQIHDEVILAVF